MPTASTLPSQAMSEICNACPGDCLDACFNDAIVATAGGIGIDELNCAGCGACLPACNLGHIHLEQGVARLIITAPSGGQA